MLDWEAEFFASGHTTEYLDEMNYWDFLNTTSRLGKMRKEISDKASGRPSFRELKPGQKEMIKKLKEKEALGLI